MDARQLDMLHHGGNEGVVAVGDGVGLALHGVAQEPVDEDGPVGGHAHSRRHVVP